VSSRTGESELKKPPTSTKARAWEVKEGTLPRVKRKYQSGGHERTRRGTEGRGKRWATRKRGIAWFDKVATKREN